MNKGKESLITKSESHAQHGCHARRCSKIFFSRTGGLIFMKLGMKHLGL